MEKLHWLDNGVIDRVPEAAASFFRLLSFPDPV